VAENSRTTYNLSSGTLLNPNRNQQTVDTDIAVSVY